MSATPEHQTSAGWVWPELLPELEEKIFSFLGPNDIPIFRQINKAAAAQFCEPQHKTFRLSAPVSSQAFAAHWLAPGATKGLTLSRRRQLLCLVAASGVVANLKLAVVAAGCLPTLEVFKAAAAAGKLDACMWLREQGCSMASSWHRGSDLLAAAAGGGHRHVCEWLLGLGLAWSSDGAAAAARSGHLDLMEWLLEQRPPLSEGRYGDADSTKKELILGVVHGCDLPTLKRLWTGWGEISDSMKWGALAAAAGSPTPDWAAKVEWLEAQGCPRTPFSCGEAARRPDAEAVDRLAWLLQRGYPVSAPAIKASALAGNVEAFSYLMGALRDPEYQSEYADVGLHASIGGNLQILQTLQAFGWLSDPPGCAQQLAGRGRVEALAWLVETRGNAALHLHPYLVNAAAASGSVEMLAWVRALGLPWNRTTLWTAITVGCAEAAEWLVARGCRIEELDDVYGSVCANGDLAMAELLRRLGVPWGPAGSDVDRAARHAPLPMLRWLLEEGCPIDDYERAMEEAMKREGGDRDEAAELLAWHWEAQQAAEAAQRA
ncbi:hypothetical protein GPECTOR_77g34 [Gonium pectorale]|uniref:Uncharacterized protein n=1 Tax=Gonium pectorale TaxID=33097 RepID=A0A150G273_GONPE|nr:hypothetical protein GPECTOR_77g34 [Gonium pectorale]|eukprot:KXZ43938.1 hypothetical protein GPECTOR_77g34 [Gonium pectorale]